MKIVTTIRRCGRFIQIEPSCDELLDVLKTVAYVALRTEPRGLRVEKAPIPLIYHDEQCGQPVMNCGSGLEPVVRSLLQDAGYQIRTVTNVRCHELPAPNLAWTSRFKQPDKPVIEFVRHHDSGLIRIDSQTVKPARLIAQLHKSWPDKRLAVVAARIDDAKLLARELRRLIGAVTLITSKHQPAVVDGPAVTTYEGLLHTATYKGHEHRVFDAAWLEIVITLDAIEAVGKIPMKCVSRLSRARLYGLVDSREQPAPLERDRMTASFGLHKIDVVRHGARQRAVEFVWCRIEGGERVNADDDLVLLKRQGLWHHGLRNRRASQLARLLRQQDHELLECRFPAVARAIKNRTVGRVAILVENVEHAAALARRLPDWNVVIGPTVFGDGQSETSLPANRYGTGWSTELPDYAIVTFEGLKILDVAHVDVVIRADGGTGMAPLSAVSNRQSAEETAPLLLIDFDDRQHRQLRRWSRQRREAYEAHHWFPAGTDHLQGRIDRFLSSRPLEVRS